MVLSPQALISPPRPQVFPMRHLRLLLTALITALLVINAAFLRRTLSLLLCGILSFNSASCYSFLSGSGNANAAVPSTSAVANSEPSGSGRKNEQRVALCVLGICVNVPSIPNILAPKTPAPAPAPTPSIPNPDSAPAATTNAPIGSSDGQSGGVDLTATWSETGSVSTIDARGCTPGYTGPFLINGKDAQGREFTLRQSGNQLIFPASTLTTTWGSGGNSGGGTQSYQGTVSGNIVTYIISGTAGGGFTTQYTGTVSADGNKVTGTGICRANSGPATANVTFTWTRKAQGSLISTGAGLTKENPVDSNWKVNNQNAFLTIPNYRWSAVQPSPGVSAQWIGPQEGSGVNSLPTGVYTYSYVFDGGDLASVSGEFASDNEATVLLNGVSLGIHNNYDNSFTVLTPFTFHPVQHQKNTLAFVVQNFYGGGDHPSNQNPSPTGLYVRFAQRKTEPGDIVMYYSKGSLSPTMSYPHVAVIIEGGVKQNSDGAMTITKVRSKWDGGAVYDHDPNDNPYGNNWTVWHRNKKPPNCMPEECNWLERNPNETDTLSDCGKKFNCLLTDKGRVIYGLGGIAPSITDEYPSRYPSAKRVDPRIGVEISESIKQILLSYDCRGFVFGQKKYKFAEYAVPYTFSSQVQEILDDGYTQVHAKDTEGKQH